MDVALTPTIRRQLGLVGRRQVLAAGGTAESIEYRLRSRRWEKILPSVYRLAGAPETWRQYLLAACLWAGPGAAISHRSAARLWELDGLREELVELSHTTKLRPPAPWLLLHRPKELAPEEITAIGEISVTSVSRALLDLGAVVSRRRVEIALDSALRERLVDYKELRGVLERHGAQGRDGTASLRYLLGERDPDYVPPESHLEREFIQILDDPRLPPAVRQYPVMEGGRIAYRLDFAYPHWGVAIEIDSYRHHFGRHSWHKDRTRGNAVVARGWRMLHFANEDKGYPEKVVRETLAALRSAGYLL